MTCSRTRFFAAVAAIALLSACSNEDSGNDPDVTGDATSSAAQETSAPQDDGRELADWTATTFLAKNSTSICEVGTQNLEIEFGEHGWCEKDVTFEQTPVTLDLIGTCDTRDQGDPISPGDLYLYVVQPSISATGDGKDNAIALIVNDSDGDWLVEDLYLTSVDPADPIPGSCPYQGMQPLSESIPLG